ncbi:MAG TPA: FAD binding domain-containing protein [Chloroflexia bacterium]|nr:FAD binding domain-containing protein [Chloroflexia bacterium]
MERFEHVDASSVAGAIDLLQAHEGRAPGTARPIAGGTDLLPTLKAGLHQPLRLVNLKTIRGLDTISDFAGTLRLGALVTLDTLQRHALVKERYQALADAASWAASPQLRNMGTLGGNLAQETRCWYYRNADFPCWLKGGETCFARQGENAHHAIFTAEGPCVSVYPSDPATALLALDATVLIQTAAGEERRAVGEYFTLPQEDHRRLNRLGPADLITGVELPPVAAGRTTSLYLKAMDRAIWSFALVGVAVAITWRTPPAADDPATIERVRIALGGVAPVPRRAPAAEAFLAGKALDGATAQEAGRLAVQGAVPLAHNTYKVHLASGLVARALLQCAGLDDRTG